MLEFVDKCLRDKRSVERNLGNLHKFPLEYLAKYMHGVSTIVHREKLLKVCKMQTNKQTNRNSTMMEHTGDHAISTDTLLNSPNILSIPLGSPNFAVKFILTSL